MASQDKGRPLPKFGEWDANDPASSEGFTVIFNKAKDEKNGSGAAGKGGKGKNTNSNQPNSPIKRFCCF